MSKLIGGECRTCGACKVLFLAFPLSIFLSPWFPILPDWASVCRAYGAPEAWVPRPNSPWDRHFPVFLRWFLEARLMGVHSTYEPSVAVGLGGITGSREKSNEAEHSR
jgi:hypothetical protein